MREHRLTRRVHFYETDLAGIVHFSWYFRYMEEAEHALWRAAGLSVVSSGHELGFPRVSVSCDYAAPLRFEDEFEVHIRVEAVSRRTITYACVITRGDTRVATGTVTAVCVGQKPGEPLRAVEIPDEIAARLRE
jgi:acyl-CoA thioester hydrolase